MQPEQVQPKSIKNRFYHLAGFLILVLNKVRHTIQGYTRPREFSVTNIDMAIKYDVDVLNRLEEQLKAYTKTEDPFTKKVVLELGPGADLGISLLALQRGAKKYVGLDVNPLARKAPKALYQTMVDEHEMPKEYTDIIPLALAGRSEQVTYLVDTNFDPRVFSGEEIDLVISNAAFEHFDDIDETIRRTADVLLPGGVFIADIDLQTHTRWIRNADPLNIYRYSKTVWDFFAFLGSPNRVRPSEFKAALEKHGFKDIKIVPRIVLDKKYTEQVQPSLHSLYKDQEDMEVLDFFIIATKK